MTTVVAGPPLLAVRTHQNSSLACSFVRRTQPLLQRVPTVVGRFVPWIPKPAPMGSVSLENGIHAVPSSLSSCRGGMCPFVGLHQSGFSILEPTWKVPAGVGLSGRPAPTANSFTNQSPR